jgi:hypothetical protein
MNSPPFDQPEAIAIWQHRLKTLNPSQCHPPVPGPHFENVMFAVEPE